MTRQRTATDRVRRAWRRELRGLVDLVLPARCVLCAARADRGGAWCGAHVLPQRPPGERCPRCAGPQPTHFAEGDPCPRCQADGPRGVGVRSTIALAAYGEQPAIREWILALKHGGRVDLAGPLARALAARLRESAPDMVGERSSALLVPVPAHFWRRFERGHDPPRLLAEQLGTELGLPAVRALARVRDTPRQGSLGAPPRAANVRDAFALRAPRALLGGRPVLLVDDVLTSGATIAECARTLRRGGARAVHAVVVASAR